MKQNIVILGSGESGMGAAKLAVKKEDYAFVSDYGNISDSNKETLKNLGVDYEENKHSLDIILKADIIVKSPGIPDNVSVIQSALKANIPVISEIEYASRFIPKEKKIIAITGTNGKTTTTLLTYHLLKDAGLNVAMAGNVGISLAGLLADTEDHEYYIIEISSFQLDGIVKFKPSIAILLNITPDHLDRYNNKFEDYVSSKFRITENLTKDECFIYCKDSKPITRELSRRNVEACLFAISSSNAVQEDAYVDGDHLIFDFTYKSQTKKHKIPLAEISLIGKHNQINVMAAVLSSLTLDISIKQILKGLKTFKNASHRLEVVDEVNNVKYINDSKATNVDSVYYALEGIDRPIVWIAGGIDKGNDYNQLQDLVRKKVKALVCLGKDNSKIKDFFSKDLDIIEEVESMRDAVKTASKLAVSGDVVLLSPACASFDLFKNYEDRGDQFRQNVKSNKTNVVNS